MSYDANGRVTSIDDASDNAYDRAYGYDDLGRLISAAGPWGNATYTYDALGNLRQRVLGARTVTTEYNAQNRVSRFRDTALGGNVWQTVSHDARGNMTVTGQTALGRPGLAYDLANQPRTISGSVTGSFIYDGNLKRVKQVMAGKTVYSVYGLSGALLHRDAATDSRQTDYIAAAGMTLARVENGVTTWPLTDHLGTPIAAQDGTGTVIWRENLTPFGEEWQAAAANDNNMSFTGHIDDDASGLTYMQARYYDPRLGRFLSNDPMGFIDMGGSPAYFNRYAYTANDPVNATDPTGENPIVLGAIIGAAGGALRGAHVASQEGGTAREVLGAALVGGVRGGAAGALAGLGVTIGPLGGVILGGAAGLLDNLGPGGNPGAGLVAGAFFGGFGGKIGLAFQRQGLAVPSVLGATVSAAEQVGGVALGKIVSDDADAAEAGRRGASDVFITIEGDYGEIGPIPIEEAPNPDELTKITTNE